MLQCCFGGNDLGSRGHLLLIKNESDSLLADLSRIAQDLHPSWEAVDTLKSAHRILNDLLLRTQNSRLTNRDKLDILIDFFFEKKSFTTLESKPKLEKYLLPYALLSRSGPHELLLLVFVGLSQALELPLQVVECRKKIVLRFLDEGKPELLDFKQGCQPLSTEEVLDLVNEDCHCTEPVGRSSLLTYYLLLLKQQAIKQRSFLCLYKIQSHLIQQQPFVLNHLVDRARAAYAIGDFVKVTEDLGQYLSYHSEMVTNNKITRLVKRLKKERISLLKMSSIKNIFEERDL